MGLSIETIRDRQKAERVGGWVADRDLYVDQKTGEVVEEDDLPGRAGCFLLCRKGRLVAAEIAERYGLGESRYPIARYGGWFELSNGKKVRGEENAKRAEKRLKAPIEDKSLKGPKEDKHGNT